jgi:hypothetical protein
MNPSTPQTELSLLTQLQKVIFGGSLWKNEKMAVFSDGDIH